MKSLITLTVIFSVLVTNMVSAEVDFKDDAPKVCLLKKAHKFLNKQKELEEKLERCKEGDNIVFYFSPTIGSPEKYAQLVGMLCKPTSHFYGSANNSRVSAYTCPYAGFVLTTVEM